MKKLTEVTFDEFMKAIEHPDNYSFNTYCYEKVMDDTDNYVKDDMFYWAFNCNNNGIDWRYTRIGFDRSAFITVSNTENVVDTILSMRLCYFDDDFLIDMKEKYKYAVENELEETIDYINREVGDYLTKEMENAYTKAFDNDYIVDIMMEEGEYAGWLDGFYIDDDFVVYKEEPVFEQVGVEMTKFSG